MGDSEELPLLKNDLILRAARGERTEKIPIWIMRQAGRYLPEFQQLRKKHDFFEVCQTPALACEVTLQPLARFELDAAIIFSDILVIPQALGLGIKMVPTQGPVFDELLSSPDDIDHMLNPKGVIDRLHYVFEAITLTRKKLDGKVPLIGFTGSPWTLMSYMIDENGNRTRSKSKMWLYRHPDDSNRLLDLLTTVIINYLVAQVRAGAQMLQVFESNAEVLSADTFDTFVLPWLQKIAAVVRQRCVTEGLPSVPISVFVKGSFHCVQRLVEAGYDVVSLDWTMPPSFIKNVLRAPVTLQGNLDPCALYAPKPELERMVGTMIDEFGPHRYIANLGHGIYPDTPIPSVETFVDVVHKYNVQ